MCSVCRTLAVVDPGDMDVARFFAYGLLGPDSLSQLGAGDHVVATIAANGIRLVIARRPSVLPRSRKDTARKTFERITKAILPASHTELRRALEREARTYSQRQSELAAPTPSESTGPHVDPAEHVSSEKDSAEVTED